MIEDDVIIRLRLALAGCGIPKDATFGEEIVEVGKQRQYRADVLVASADKKTPLYVFEAKANRQRSVAYSQTWDRLHGLSVRCLCYVVTSEDDVIWVARIVGAVAADDAWVQLSDIVGMKRLFGVYEEKSDRAIAKNVRIGDACTNEDLVIFRRVITCGGVLTVLLLYAIEIGTGRIISYPLAGLLALVMVLYAASYGIVREFKVKDYVLTFRDPNKNERRSGVCVRE